jgi:acyl-coenzyme A thioesterase PaaI-like protein
MTWVRQDEGAAAGPPDGDGNPMISALHGGTVAALLESTAAFKLALGREHQRNSKDHQHHDRLSPPRPRRPGHVRASVDHENTGEE